MAEKAVARGHSESVSAWVNDALRYKLAQERRLEALSAFVARYESEHGKITPEEIRLAQRRMRSDAVPVRGARGAQEAGCAAAWTRALSLLLDAGALIAVERDDRDVIAVIKHELREGRPPLTRGGVVGQVWRGGRQARLARLLPGVDIVPLDGILGRRAGILLGRAGMADVIDAALILLAADGDIVLTSDLDDLAPLAAAGELQIDVVPV